MDHTVRDLLVVAAGLCTSILTTFVLWLCLHYFHFAIYGFSYWFVPIGAVVCGVTAASGYYWAALKLHRKATGLVLANLLCMAVSTYFVVHYLQYYSIDVSGQHVRDLISFATYLDLVIRNQKVGLMMTGLNTGALGIFGYVLMLVQIGGFAYGGFYLFSKLRLRAYCERCEAPLGQRAIGFFAQWGLPVPPGNCRLATDIVFCPCMKCGGQWVQFQGRKLRNGDYRNVGSWYVAGFASTPVIAMRQDRIDTSE